MAAPLESIVIRHASGATATLYPFGAQLTSFVTAEGQDILFVSSKAVFDGSKAIRGGIPIVFPQFAGQGPLTFHGFARTSTWAVEEVGDGSAVLSLADSEATRAVWPHAFKLVYRVAFDNERLTTSLSVVNPTEGAGPFPFEALLHTYIHLGKGNVAADGSGSIARVHGLAGVLYKDKPSGGEERVEEGDAFPLAGEVDRVYISPPEAVIRVSGITAGAALGAGRAVTAVGVERRASVRAAPPALHGGVEHAPPLDCVVWNPGAVRAATIADLGSDDWHEYVCVEPGRVSSATAAFHAHAAPGLMPGREWTMVQTLHLERA